MYFVMNDLFELFCFKLYKWHKSYTWIVVQIELLNLSRTRKQSKISIP